MGSAFATFDTRGPWVRFLGASPTQMFALRQERDRMLEEAASRFGVPASLMRMSPDPVEEQVRYNNQLLLSEPGLVRLDDVA